MALPVSTSLPHPAAKVLTRCFFDASARQGPFLGAVGDSRQGAQHIVNIDLAAIVNPVRAFSPLTGLSVAAILAGGFAWLEAVRGWCIVRACGIKTKW